MIGYEHGRGYIIDFLGDVMPFEAKDVHHEDLDGIKLGASVVFNTWGLIETPEGLFRRYLDVYDYQYEQRIRNSKSEDNGNY